jgi:hypothetical protein
MKAILTVLLFSTLVLAQGKPPAVPLTQSQVTEQLTAAIHDLDMKEIPLEERLATKPPDAEKQSLQVARLKLQTDFAIANAPLITRGQEIRASQFSIAQNVTPTPFDKLITRATLIAAKK